MPTVVPVLVALMALAVALGALVFGARMLRRQQAGQASSGAEQALRSYGRTISPLAMLMAKAVGAIFILAGVLLSLVILLAWNEHRVYTNDGIPVAGVVAGNNETQSRTGDRETAFKPIISYEVDGVKYRIEGSRRSKPAAEGSTVELAYLPDEPGEARVMGAGTSPLVALVGLVPILIGLATLRFMPSYIRRASETWETSGR